MATVKSTPPKRRKPRSAARSHCFGAHLSIAGGVDHALSAALRLNLDTVQVFVKNQRQWQSQPLKPDVVDRWHQLLTAPGFGPPLAHATYLINLASADAQLYERSRRAFAEELLRCERLSIPGLVVHPGAAGHQPRRRAIARVAAALNRIFRDHPGLKTMPLLETTAGQGTTLGGGFEELGAIIRLLDEPRRVGVCIDTCHVFAAGYDIRQPDGYERMIAEAQRWAGLERIHCWHLNDSKGACGSRLDRHEHIGHGQIGKRGFRQVLSDRRFRGVPMIIETPKGEDASGRDWDRVNVRRLRAIAAHVAPI
jgi:deoxyribonuclease-4